MGDRIEAAAKAICDVRHHPDREAWINMPDDLKEIYRQQARAALAAADREMAKRKFWQCPKCKEHFHQYIIDDGVAVCFHGDKSCPVVELQVDQKRGHGTA